MQLKYMADKMMLWNPNAEERSMADEGPFSGDLVVVIPRITSIVSKSNINHSLLKRHFLE